MRGSGAGLKWIDHELVTQAPIENLAGGGPDGAGDPGVEPASLELAMAAAFFIWTVAVTGFGNGAQPEIGKLRIARAV